MAKKNLAMECATGIIFYEQLKKVPTATLEAELDRRNAARKRILRQRKKIRDARNKLYAGSKPESEKDSEYTQEKVKHIRRLGSGHED